MGSDCYFLDRHEDKYWSGKLVIFGDLGCSLCILLPAYFWKFSSMFISESLRIHSSEAKVTVGTTMDQITMLQAFMETPPCFIPMPDAARQCSSAFAKNTLTDRQFGRENAGEDG